MIKKAQLVLIILFLLIFKKNYAQGTWHNLGNGATCDTNIAGLCYPVVLATCADTINNVLYVGGDFNTAGNIKQFAIAEWDDTKWDSLPNEGLSDVDALIMYHDSLYVGEKNAGGVYRFNGSTWTSLPGFYGAVYCFGIYKDTLYAGGEFSKSGSTIINNIAKWDGTKWLPLRGGVSGGTPDEVNAMTVYHDTLIVGGLFTTADTMPAFSIAKWDGANWSDVGTGITDWSGSFIRQPGYVFALENFQGKLYTSGEFDSAGGVGAFSIASWNGNQWDTLGIPDLYVTSHINALKSFNGYLFMSSNVYINYVAKFDGKIFSPVDSGVNVEVNSLTVWNGSLYVGGDFDTTGKTIPANAIARWKPDSISTATHQLSLNNEQIDIYPNPTSNQLSITNKQLPISEIQIEDVLGRTLIYRVFDNNLQRQTIDLSILPQGIYFYRVTDSNSQMVTGKFVKE